MPHNNKTISKTQTNINDRFGRPILCGDNLILEFESITIKGIARWSEEDKYWELFKDENNHVGIEHNKERIRII